MTAVVQRTPLDEARAERARCAEQVREWEQRLADARAAVEEAEQGAGHALLDAKRPALGDHARHVAELRAAVDLATSTLKEARVRARAALQRLYRAEADQVDREAHEAFAVAAEHQGNVAALLDEVERLEGFRYLPPMSEGVMASTRGNALAMRAMELREQAKQLRARRVPEVD